MHWFGSADAFENNVRNKLLPIIKQKLGRHAFAYKIVVLACVPASFCYLDHSSVHWRRYAQTGEKEEMWKALAYILATFRWLLCDHPLVVLCVLTNARLLIKPSRNRFFYWLRWMSLM